MPSYNIAIAPHLVEFTIAGVLLDNVVYTSGGPLGVTGSSPAWTVVIPNTWKPASCVMNAIAAGSGGAAGGNNATNACGGAGGGGGQYVLNIPYIALPGDSITVSIGAKGTGGLVAGTAATAGGNTVVTNNTNATRSAFMNGIALTLHGGGQPNILGVSQVPAQGAATISTAGATGSGPYIGGAGGSGGAGTGGAGSAAGAGSSVPMSAVVSQGTGGGGSGTGATTAGAGGTLSSSTGYTIWPPITAATATGNLGGGSFGSPSPWGFTGTPGNGGSAATNATGYGSGGSGGGGNGAGGNGADGYVAMFAQF